MRSDMLYGATELKSNNKPSTWSDTRLNTMASISPRKNELEKLLIFLGANPVEKIDRAFKEKFKSGVLEYLDLN